MPCPSPFLPLRLAFAGYIEMQGYPLGDANGHSNNDPAFVGQAQGLKILGHENQRLDQLD